MGESESREDEWDGLESVGVTRLPNEIQIRAPPFVTSPYVDVPFGVTYEKIGTIQRRLAWPLHKDDTLSRSGRSTDLNIYCWACLFFSFLTSNPTHLICIPTF
ncbi:hypothetical protein HWV62_36646 [Athelia sp. TMB]|nr:hypothetical protein HWV62_36646 [Athelia sp. TMB]